MARIWSRIWPWLAFALWLYIGPQLAAPFIQFWFGGVQ